MLKWLLDLKNFLLKEFLWVSFYFILKITLWALKESYGHGFWMWSPLQLSMPFALKLGFHTSLVSSGRNLHSVCFLAVRIVWEHLRLGELGPLLVLQFTHVHPTTGISTSVSETEKERLCSYGVVLKFVTCLL